jgi:hypothetical protein
MARRAPMVMDGDGGLKLLGPVRDDCDGEKYLITMYLYLIRGNASTTTLLCTALYCLLLPTVYVVYMYVVCMYVHPTAVMEGSRDVPTQASSTEASQP